VNQEKHKIFSDNPVTIDLFGNNVDVLSSLAQPKKVTGVPRILFCLELRTKILDAPMSSLFLENPKPISVRYYFKANFLNFLMFFHFSLARGIRFKQRDHTWRFIPEFLKI
jgi:hypothetical protein